VLSVDTKKATQTTATQMLKQKKGFEPGRGLRRRGFLHGCVVPCTWPACNLLRASKPEQIAQYRCVLNHAFQPGGNEPVVLGVCDHLPSRSPRWVVTRSVVGSESLFGVERVTTGVCGRCEGWIGAMCSARRRYGRSPLRRRCHGLDEGGSQQRDCVALEVASDPSNNGLPVADG